MTEEEVLAMKAGLEFDALIHEHVMGHSYSDFHFEVAGKIHISVGLAGPLHYSVDPASAWQVVEYMSKQNFHVNIQNCCTHENPWCVHICSNEEGKANDYFGMASGEFPLAVCQAALIAKLGLGKEEGE